MPQTVELALDLDSSLLANQQPIYLPACWILLYKYRIDQRSDYPAHRQRLWVLEVD